uniref:Uncharacterized protein n=1 Tax=Mycena chlorophos TaxID=658473 RepID=A0ABQ0LZG8_MYCCL|nr:predicted protein [Mycena chlorophos]
MSSSSGSPSTSRASSESLPEVPLAKNNPSKAARQAKASTTDAGNRNEGTDPHWAYKPPSGAVLLDSSAELGEFDWDALNADEDNELWLIRLPDGLKPKYLENAQLEVPSGSSKAGTAKLGTIQRKRMAYDVWSVGGGDSRADPGDEKAGTSVCGEEIKGISCLLPRRTKKGKLYAAPRAIARTLVVAAQEAAPTPAESTPTTYKNPPREIYPQERLKHAFVPYGAGFKKPEEGAEEVEKMEVDSSPTKEKEVQDEDEKPKKDKSKKRKGEEGAAESPKKKKKVKTS